MLGVYVALAALTLTMLGMLVKITTFITTINVVVDEIRAERPLVRTIPLIDHRLGSVEKTLGMYSHQDGE